MIENGGGLPPNGRGFQNFRAHFVRGTIIEPPFISSFLTSIHSVFARFTSIDSRNDLKNYFMYTAQLGYVNTGFQFFFEAQYNLSPWCALQC